MIRIDDERWGEGEFVVNSLPLEITMERSDAWNKKTGAHALTLEMELMHEAAKQGTMHHFSSERGPALARAAGTNREIDAWNKKTDAHALILELELMHEAEK